MLFSEGLKFLIALTDYEEYKMKTEIKIIDNNISEYKMVYSTQRGTYGYYAATELSNRIFGV